VAKAELKSARKVLQHWKSSSNGGLDIKGFFTLGRAMFMAALSQIITYLLIMIEFKKDDYPSFLNDMNVTQNATQQ